MKFVNRHARPIRSLTGWGRVAPPASKKHWKPGRSAYELAAAWIGEAEPEAVALLNKRRELRPVTLDTGVAEKRTAFDEIPRGPRNHDLLLRAHSGERSLVVGVEGKADEPFDHPLWRWRARALARSPNSEAPLRLDHLTRLFFGTTISRDWGHPGVGGLGYQLVSGLAGTLADAKQEQASQAVLLIHEFVTDLTDDEKHAANAGILDDFVARLAGTRRLPRSRTTGGWVTAPITVRGDGDWMPKATEVFVAKLITNRRAA